MGAPAMAALKSDVAAAPPPVDIGAYAEILGRTWLQGDESVTRELAERRLAADEWASARAYWIEAIDEDVARGGKELVLAFAARFEASRRAQSPDPPARPAEPAPEVIDVPEEVQAVAIAVPSYLAAPAPAPAPAPASTPSRRGGTALGVSMPLGPATPFAAPPAAIASAALAEDGPDLTVPPVKRAEPTLPFAQAASGAVPPAVEALKGAGRREPDVPSADGDETAFLLASALRDKLALPFQGASPPAEAPPHFSLGEYARFLVAFAATKDADVDALRSRFGIASAAMQRTIGAAFAARFAREPAARAEFDAIPADLRRGETR